MERAPPTPPDTFRSPTKRVDPVAVGPDPHAPERAVGPVRDSRRASFARTDAAGDERFVPLRDERAVHEAVELLNTAAAQRRDSSGRARPSRAPLPPAGSGGGPSPSEDGYGLGDTTAALASTRDSEGPLLKAFRDAQWDDDKDDEELAVTGGAVSGAASRHSSATDPAANTTHARRQSGDGRVVYDELPPEYAEFEDDLGLRQGDDDSTRRTTLDDIVISSGDGVSRTALQSDDLLYENTVLKEKLVAERAKVRRAQDKLYFLLLKSKGKDEQMLALKATLRAKTRDIEERDAQLASMQAHQTQMQRRIDNMQAHITQLEFDKFKLMNPTGKRTEDELEETHRRGVQKAKMLLAHQLFKQQADKRIEELSSGIRVQRKQMRRKMQCLEQMCMEYEDDHAADTMHALMRTLRFGQAQTIEEQRRQLTRELRFERTVNLSAPDDEHIRVLLSKTHYAGLMPQCKIELGSTVRELKEMMDRTLQQLWMLFNERGAAKPGLQAKPPHRVYDEFYKAVDQALLRSKQAAAEFPRKTNAFMRAFCKREKEVTQHIRDTRYSTVDQSAEADFPYPTPPEVFELRDEVAHYKRRLRQLNQEHAERENGLEMRAGKAESSLEYLQKHVLALHRALYNTLHLVFKHRFRWTNRLPDPMRGFTIPDQKNRRRIFEVSYNMKLGELLQVDKEYMERFGHYMISDDFGAGGVISGDTAQARVALGAARRASSGATRENAGKEAPGAEAASKQPRAPPNADRRGEAHPRRRSWSVDAAGQAAAAADGKPKEAATPPGASEGEVLSNSDTGGAASPESPSPPTGPGGSGLPSHQQPIGNVRRSSNPASRQDSKAWQGLVEDSERNSGAQRPSEHGRPRPGGMPHGRAPLPMPIVADVTKFPDLTTASAVAAASAAPHRRSSVDRGAAAAVRRSRSGNV
eukprot:TRINITY_DN60644_c0_g1_i1.p1 TRINITY_DN60644_c0_g1~~TRINITY_DN60644_c0_g1_i1.p1  ORF type:complete len:924 (+),score=291.44 TRINITY_DN60644_c0_g1_i1:108-2879(+)